MRFPDGKPDHIEDYLCTVREGQWFGWSDANNKIYANLIVHDGGTKPTEKQCTDGLATLVAEWELEFDSYRSKRRAEYPRFEEQFDQIYNEGIDAWKASIKAIKDKYPKP
tara:strand:+ start:185 stop:514 length:330 start_codon:yes stop_codon:yes gene_type:complete